MGNCSTLAKPTCGSSHESKQDKRERFAQQLRDEINILMQQKLYHQAILKMHKLCIILREIASSSVTPKSNLQELMEVQIEMGRISQDYAHNHVKAVNTFQNAIDTSSQIFGPNNEIIIKVIQPLIIISAQIIEESMGPLKQKLNTVDGLEATTQKEIQQEIKKAIVRSSTHATTRISAPPASLNIIFEDPFEQEEWDEKRISHIPRDSV